MSVPPPIGPPSAARRRGPRVALWTTLGAAVIVGGAAALHVAANVGYDDARARVIEASEQVEAGLDDLAAAAADLDLDGQWATGVAEADSGLLLPEDRREDLDEAVSDAAAIQEAAERSALETPRSPGDKPSWPWELLGETAALDERAIDLAGREDELTATLEDVRDAKDDLGESAVAAMRAAAEASEAFEAAHLNARNPEIVRLRAAAETIVSAPGTLTVDARSRYEELEDAAAAVLATEKEELAEKSGPLREARVAVEAFARDLAPGVLLDFDWSATVRGYDGPSYGGWTQWWYADPGYATIALSDRIAREWPQEWTRALVAHEVGHAISVKCRSMYDPADQDTVEEWATAWAIGKGFTDRSNGVAEYGMPSQRMIDAAAQCR